MAFSIAFNDDRYCVATRADLMKLDSFWRLADVPIETAD